jgi:tetratricopeptide (TPR) repeat protein
LNGDGQSRGVLYVMKNFSGTKAANLCNYYAGVSYLKLGDFNNAVKYLKDFSTSAKQIQLMAYGCLGDAYSELNKKEEAIDSYKKAATAFDTDESNSAEYLFRAALLEETNGKPKEALELYKELKDKFPKTDKGFLADKYIYRLSIEKS